jgi:2-oxoglutarate dehydrogenase E2 component (dihydrolipoamide succinyltransferase)
MTIKVVVPELGESVVEATVHQWLKGVGDYVNVGEALVTLETDKVDVEVGAEKSGVLQEILAEEGKDVAIGDVLATIDEKAEGKSDSPTEKAEEPAAAEEPAKKEKPAKGEEPVEDEEPVEEEKADQKADGRERVSPVAKRMAEDSGIRISVMPRQRACRAVVM